MSGIFKKIKKMGSQCPLIVLMDGHLNDHVTSEVFRRKPCVNNKKAFYFTTELTIIYYNVVHLKIKTIKVLATRSNVRISLPSERRTIISGKTHFLLKKEKTCTVFLSSYS